MATHPVFISYARKSSRTHAEALHRELGGDTGLAFLDTSDIETLQKFPAKISDALLAAKVVVVFADETYFTRWYCLREFDLALTPFQKLARGGAGETERQEALDHVVLALPDAGMGSLALKLLPPSLRITNRLRASDTEKVSEIVKQRLAQVKLNIGQHLDALMQAVEAEAIRRRLSEQGAMPQPKSLHGLRLFPAAIERSLGEGFKGRADDLWRLHHAVWTMGVGAAALTGAIAGGGGYGKSRLAIEYLHRYGPDYYQGGVFWIDAAAADDELKQERAFHGILCTIEPATPELKALHERGKNARDELTRALQQLPNQEPVLFLIDNVPESESSARPLPLSTWCPALGHVTALATSRMHVHLEGGNIRELNIDVLAPADSVALLTYGVDQVSVLTYERWSRIAEWVGRLPLALDLLQRVMKAGALLPGELDSMATDSRPTTAELDRLTNAISLQLPLGAVRGITEALNVSYDRLPAEAKTAARLIAQLAPEPIPLALLKALGNEVDQPSARAALVTRSFVTPVESVANAGKKVEFLGRMHRVLSDFIRAKSPDSSADLRRAAKALLDVMGPDSSRNPGKWPLMSACMPHAELMFEGLLQGGEKEDAELAVDVGLGIGILHSAQGAAEKARKIEEQTLEFASKRLGPEDTRTLAAMGNLAETLRDQGDLERARKLHEHELGVSMRILGGEHSDTLTSMSNLALTLSDLGDLPGARKLKEQVLEVFRRVLGEEDLKTLTAMGNVAAMLSDQGDFEGARKLEEPVLDAHTRILGAEHPATLISMVNLAATLRSQGDLKGARKLEKEVLDARTRILGAEHPATLNSMGNLAATLGAQGDLEGARKLEEQVLDARTRIRGSEHPETLATMSNLAGTLRDQGDLEGARKLQEQVLGAFTRILGEEHPDTLTSMSNLALTLGAQGDPEGARKLQEQVLDARTRILGAEHPATTVVAWNLFSTLRDQGKTEQANAILELNLKWLLNRTPETLSHQQRQIREMLEKFLRRPR